MIRNGSRTRKRLLLCTLFAIAALLASVGVAAGAPAASADGTVATTAVAQDDPDEVTLEVTKVFHRTPDNPHNVTVEYVVENPEIVQRSDVDDVTFDVSELEDRTRRSASQDVFDHEGFQAVGEHNLSLTAQQGNATIWYHYDDTLDSSHNDVERDDDVITQIVPNDVMGPDEIHVVADTSGATTVDPEYTYGTADEGFVTSGNSQAVRDIDKGEYSETEYFPMVVMGDFQTHTAHDDGRSVTLVVPNGTELREPIPTVAERIAETYSAVEAGYTDSHRYVIVNDEIDGKDWVKGMTRSENARWALVLSNQPVYATWNTWAEELVHSTDPMEFESSSSGGGWQRAAQVGGSDGLSWLHDAYAVHRAMRTSLETGHGSFEDYHAHLEYGTRVDAFNHGSSGQDHEKYYFGPLVVQALDYQLRAASDGENTTDDFVREVGAIDGEANESEVLDVVRELGNDTVAQRADAWFVEDGDAAPEPLTLEQYQDVYGPVPNTSTSLSSVTVTSNRGTTTVETDGPLAVREGATVEYELQVHNDGDGDGRYKVQLRDADDNPFVGEPATVHEEDRGHVAAGETETFTYSHTFTETGTYELDVGDVVPHNVTTEVDPGALDNPSYVTVVPRDAVIVRDDAGDGEDGLDAVVTNDTSTIVYQGDTTDEYLSESLRSGLETNEYGVREFDPESWADPGEDDCLAFSLYGEWRCVASLPPVDGTIPQDVDDDGDYMDLNGDGAVTDADVDRYHQNRYEESIEGYLPAYDYSDNGEIDHADVIAIYNEAT